MASPGGQPSFPGTHANGEVAPKAAISVTSIEPASSTESCRVVAAKTIDCPSPEAGPVLGRAMLQHCPCEGPDQGPDRAGDRC
jgi:hypothetical protein